MVYCLAGPGVNLSAQVSGMGGAAHTPRAFTTLTMSEYACAHRAVNTFTDMEETYRNSMPSHFQFSKDERRVYFLGSLAPGADQTLLCVQLNEGAIDGTPLPVLPTFDAGSKAYSKEEELLRERKRLTTTGITDYQYDAETSTFVIPISGSIYTLTLGSDEPLGDKQPQLLPTAFEGARMDCKICHQDPDLISFTRDRNIWVQRRSTGIEVMLTQLTGSTKVSAGTPSFIVQVMRPNLSSPCHALPRCHAARRLGAARGRKKPTAAEYVSNSG